MCTCVLQALYDRRFEEALQITREQCLDKDHVTEFLNLTDTEEGYLEECFEYRYHPQGRKGTSLLFYAVLYDQVEMVKLLVENGAGI